MSKIKSKIGTIGVATVVLIAIISLNQIVLAVSLHEEYQGTYTPITLEHHVDAKDGLSELPEYSDEADLILVHRLEPLEWYHPDIYNNMDVRYYRCRMANGSSANEEVLSNISDKNTIIITSWRQNRGRCIQNSERLSDFKQVKSGHYQMYTNY